MLAPPVISGCEVATPITHSLKTRSMSCPPAQMRVAAAAKLSGGLRRRAHPFLCCHT